MEAPCKAIGEVVSEPRPEMKRVGGDAVPALTGSGIGSVYCLCRLSAHGLRAKLGGNAKTFVLKQWDEGLFF